MVWWIQVLELADTEGTGTGRYQLTARSDEDGGGPYPLCSHEHETIEQAQQCEEARREADRY